MILGITGHQNLAQYNLGWLRQTFNLIILNNPVKMGISNLAVGSDQLFANFLVTKQINIGVVIPCKHYEKTFKNVNDLTTYQNLLKKALYKEQLDFDQPNEVAFFEAGKMVANKADLMVAIWDGQKAKGLGGTADIVSYCKEINKRLIHINPVEQIINYVDYAD